jgi:hypothetical protein
MTAWSERNYPVEMPRQPVATPDKLTLLDWRRIVRVEKTF